MSESLEFKNQRIIPVDLETEMKRAFLEYAMSVIIDRALPDVRDGLKPVHRRILYSMYTNGFTPDKAFRKCATTVGDVLGRFHPHGDAAVYDAMVRMAQDWSLRHTLVDGNGNFGSLDGDAPAAYRYTEARLTKISLEMLADINKDTVDFKPNFDEHENEPVVLPSKFPNLLVNGSMGIAVGMATNIPPHNLCEVIDGVKLIIDNPEATLDDLLEVIKGPDFPVGATIMGRAGIRQAYATGRGRIVVRSDAEIEDMPNGRQRIVVSSIPFQVNKARLIEKIAELIKEKRVEGISDIRDESALEEQVRIVIELKRDANASVVLNQLYKHTSLQEAFNANMVAIVQNKEGKYEPKLITLREALDHYLQHQVEVLVRRIRFDLKKAEMRAHILEGLRIAVANLDRVIKIIRSSMTEEIAKQGLMDEFSLSDKQAQAIVDMRLGRLTGLEQDKLEKEYNELLEKIEYYKKVIASTDMQFDIIKQELDEIKAKYGDARRTKIVAAVDDILDEDLIKEENSCFTLTNRGYVKRLPADTYKLQHRGGVGKTGLTTREEDFIESLFVSSTHNYIMFFTNKGKVYRMKGYEIPESGRMAKGTAIVNLLQLDNDEKISAVFPVKQSDMNNDGMTEAGSEKYIVTATKHGIIKKTELSKYSNIRKGGLIAVALRDDDELVSVQLTDGTNDMIMVTKTGKAIVFNEKDVRETGRGSMGVRGIKLVGDDEVVGMAPCANESQILLITENGYGKRTNIEEYRNQSRGGKGVITYRVTEKTGNIVGMQVIDEDCDIMLISSDGSIIRVDVNEISILGRATQGVKVMRTMDDVTVVSFTKTEKLDEDDLQETDEHVEISDAAETVDETIGEETTVEEQ